MKRLFSMFCVVAMIIALAIPTAAADYSNETAEFLPELVKMTSEEIETLPFDRGLDIMKAAFPRVPDRVLEDIEEEDLRIGLQMLAFSMKQKMILGIMSKDKHR